MPDAERWRPPAALLGSQRCDAEGALAQVAPGSLSSLSRPVFCARPRGHVGEHAERAPRGPRAWWRDEARGWWSWPPAGGPGGPASPRGGEVDAVAVHDTSAPEVAAGAETECGAAGRIRYFERIPWTGFATAPRVEAVTCARPAGHALPHCTRPSRGDRRALSPAGAWVWWAWPPPPLPDPTPDQRWRVHRQRVIALLVGLVVLGGPLLAAVLLAHS